MIIKLLKYDLRGMGKKLLPLYGLALALSLINRLNDTLFIRPLLEGGGLYRASSFAATLSGILMGVFVITLIAIFIVTFFMLIAKYNRSVFGDEAYLTHTLPITQDQIIISKALNFLFWGFVSTLVAGVSFLILTLGTDSWNYFGVMWQSFSSSFAYVWGSIGANNRLAAGLFVLTGLLGPLAEILNIFLCIGIGNKFRHKIAAGVVAYLIINSLMSALTGGTTSNLAERMVLIQNYNPAHYLQANFLPLALFLLLVTVGQTLIYYFATRYLQNKQLNLD